MWKEAQWARKSPAGLTVQSHLISSSDVSHSIPTAVPPRVRATKED